MYVARPKHASCRFLPRSAESRAAATAWLPRQPIFIVDFGTLPICLPSYEKILRDWKEEGDPLHHVKMRDNTLFRCAVLKDSDGFGRIKASAITEAYKRENRREPWNGRIPGELHG